MQAYLLLPSELIRGLYSSGLLSRKMPHLQQQQQQQVSAWTCCLQHHATRQQCQRYTWHLRASPYTAMAHTPSSTQHQLLAVRLAINHQRNGSTHPPTTH
jgi:hypothetical protein